MSPIERLRLFFEKDPELRPLSTQAGLARLFGRSESLLRSIEKGRAKMSKKLARKISEQLGVDEAWLTRAEVTGESIPALGGGQLDYLQVLSRITHRMESNLEKVKPAPVALDLTKRRMLDAVLGMVAAEVLQFWDVPDDVCPDPVPELLEWLRNRSKIRCWHTMARSPSAQTRGGGNDNPEMS